VSLTRPAHDPTRFHQSPVHTATRRDRGADVRVACIGAVGLHAVRLAVRGGTLSGQLSDRTAERIDAWPCRTSPDADACRREWARPLGAFSNAQRPSQSHRSLPVRFRAGHDGGGRCYCGSDDARLSIKRCDSWRLLHSSLTARLPPSSSRPAAFAERLIPFEKPVAVPRCSARRALSACAPVIASVVKVDER